MGERLEAILRIPIGIVSGIVMWAWAILIKIFAVINFVWTLASGKRIKEIAELSDIWNTQNYVFIRYMTFLSNERPFPFSELSKSLSKYSSSKA